MSSPYKSNFDVKQSARKRTIYSEERGLKELIESKKYNK